MCQLGLSSLDALSFHHEGEKEFGIGAKGYTRSWEKVKAELDECILVCSNCHAEIHAGLGFRSKSGVKTQPN
jgi:GH18 family chitinase